MTSGNFELPAPAGSHGDREDSVAQSLTAVLSSIRGVCIEPVSPHRATVGGSNRRRLRPGFGP